MPVPSTSRGRTDGWSGCRARRPPTRRSQPSKTCQRAPAALADPYAPFAGKTVAVIGGGDSGKTIMEFLARIGPGSAAYGSGRCGLKEPMRRRSEGAAGPPGGLRDGPNAQPDATPPPLRLRDMITAAEQQSHRAQRAEAREAALQLEVQRLQEVNAQLHDSVKAAASAAAEEAAAGERRTLLHIHLLRSALSEADVDARRLRHDHEKLRVAARAAIALRRQRSAALLQRCCRAARRRIDGPVDRY